MAIIDTDTLVGELEIVDRPREIFWTKPWDFVKILTKVLRVKFPVNRNNNFIVSGDETPGPDDTTKLWAALDTNRNPLGWRAFVKSAWKNFYTFPAGHVEWIMGDSSKPPDGFQVLTDENVTGLDAAVWIKLKSMYVETAPSSGVYKYYAARFIGY